ncbi:MAG: hypothetical protein EXR84_00285 [Gammaproteobacteria bacterium]|nr:hypothetical protein [Gammaproteobacteria bacterium]
MRKPVVPLLLISLFTSCTDELNRTRPYVLTTATTGGTYYPVGVALAGVLQWHLEDELNFVTAGLLLISAGLLMWMSSPFIYNLVGAGILFGVIFKQNRDRKLRAAAAT